MNFSYLWLNDWTIILIFRNSIFITYYLLWLGSMCFSINNFYSRHWGIHCSDTTLCGNRKYVTIIFQILHHVAWKDTWLLPVQSCWYLSKLVLQVLDSYVMSLDLLTQSININLNQFKIGLLLFLTLHQFSKHLFHSRFCIASTRRNLSISLLFIVIPGPPVTMSLTPMISIPIIIVQTMVHLPMGLKLAI